MGWPSKLTDRELKRDSLLMSCTSPNMVLAIAFPYLFFHLIVNLNMGNNSLFLS